LKLTFGNRLYVLGIIGIVIVLLKYIPDSNYFMEDAVIVPTSTHKALEAGHQDAPPATEIGNVESKA
jgi:hypothetical protein